MLIALRRLARLSGACAPHRWLVRGSVAAVVLVLAQAALGGLTVEQGLEDELVAAHLGAGDAAARPAVRAPARRRQTAAAAAPRAVRGLRRSRPSVAAVLVLATIVAGGYVAGTEYHGTDEQPLVGAHEACGTGWSTDQFPGCNGQGSLSFGQTRLADIQLAHRAVHVPGGDLGDRDGRVALRAPRARAGPSGSRRCCSSPRSRSGAINVWAGKHAGLIIGHLALGTIALGDRRLRERDADARLRPAPSGSAAEPATEPSPPSDGERDHRRPAARRPIATSRPAGAAATPARRRCATTSR